MVKFRLGTVGMLTLVMSSLPNCGGNTEIDANSQTGGSPDSAGANSSNVGGTGGLVTSTGGIPSAGGAYTSGGRAPIGGGTGCFQGVTCTGIAQCANELGDLCQCNGGLYSCFTVSFGGSPSTGGQTAVPTGCSQGADCTGFVQCQQYSPPYQRCQCNGGKYSCDYTGVGGATSTGGQAGVGGANACSPGATCTGIGQCMTPPAPYTRCQCNGGLYSCN